MSITEVVPRENYRLFLRFEGGVEGVVDLTSLAGRGVFAAWSEPGVFERVTVSDTGALEWPGDLDLCPDALYLKITGKRPEDVFPALRRIPSHA